MNKRFTPDELVEGFSQLHTLPEVYFRIKAVVDNPESQSTDLVREISTDLALSARLLRVVNSPLYARHGKVESMPRAVAVLGTRCIHDLVLATAVTGMLATRSFGEFDLRAHWKSSFLTALITRALGESLRGVDKDRLFLEGLLARVGELVMNERAGSVARIVARHAANKGAPLHTIQRAFLGCHYGEVGAALLRRWALPPTVCEAVACHLEPATHNESVDAALLRVGASLFAWGESAAPIGTFMDALAEDFIRQNTLDAQAFQTIYANSEAELNAVLQAFMPMAATVA